MEKKSLWIIGVILVVIIIGSLYYFNQNNNTIQIGSIQMLTGVGAAWGENSVKGIDLAIEEINENGGINGKMLEVIYEDDQSDNAVIAVTAMNSLIQRGIKIIIGPDWSSAGVAVAPVICSNKIIGISATLGVAAFNEECDYVFNFWPSDAIISEKLGEYIYTQGGKRKIAILGSQQVWEQEQAESVRKGFENAGGEVVSFQLPLPDQVDFRTEILKIRESDAEAIVIQSMQSSSASRQIRELLGDEIQIYLVHTDATMIKNANGALEGAILMNGFTPSDEFATKFEVRYGKTADIGSDTSYDVVYFIAQAIESTNSTDPTVLKDYMNSVKTFDGASGNLVFDGKGRITKEPQLETIKDSKRVTL